MNIKFFPGLGKPGIFVLSQVNLGKKVMEKSCGIQHFPKRVAS